MFCYAQVLSNEILESSAYKFTTTTSQSSYTSSHHDIFNTTCVTHGQRNRFQVDMWSDTGSKLMCWVSIWAIFQVVPNRKCFFKEEVFAVVYKAFRIAVLNWSFHVHWSACLLDKRQRCKASTLISLTFPSIAVFLSTPCFYTASPKTHDQDSGSST